MNSSADALSRDVPRWHRIVLGASCVHSGLWGAFIIAMPTASSKVYGFAHPPREIHLWQAAGLFISLLAVGYAIASTNPRQHWCVVLIGLLAKVFGAVGMCVAVFREQVSPDVLWLLPLNDVVWWWPFWSIVRSAQSRKNGRFFAADEV